MRCLLVAYAMFMAGGFGDRGVTGCSPRPVPRCATTKLARRGPRGKPLGQGVRAEFRPLARVGLAVAQLHGVVPDRGRNVRRNDRTSHR
jgi:hypothetical protein